MLGDEVFNQLHRMLQITQLFSSVYGKACYPLSQRGCQNSHHDVHRPYGVISRYRFQLIFRRSRPEDYRMSNTNYANPLLDTWFLTIVCAILRVLQRYSSQEDDRATRKACKKSLESLCQLYEQIHYSLRLHAI